MAEYIMRDMVEKAGLSREIRVASAATSTEEIGHGVYPPAKRMLSAHGIDCTGKTARQITPQDFTQYDYVVCMEHYNLHHLRTVVGAALAEKACCLLDFTAHPRDIADPWYTGDFEATWRDCVEGCEALLHYLQQTSA